MGAHASSLRAGLAADYRAALAARAGAPGGGGPPHRAPAPARGLTLSEVLALRAAPRAWDVGAPSLTLLMALDSNRDGYASMDELAAFGASASASASAARGGPFADAVRGDAALAAAAELAAPGGVDAVADWLVALAVADGGLAAGGAPPPAPGLVHRDAVAALAALLTPADADDGGSGTVYRDSGAPLPPPPGFRALFDALQAAAEDAALLDPADPALDDWLPVPTLRAFARGAVEGVADVLGRVCGGVPF